MKLLTSSAWSRCFTIALLLCAGTTFAADDKAKPATPPASAREPSVIAPPKPFAPIDINSAKKNEFKKLNGVTEAHADKIIAGRPYTTKYSLVTDKIIPEDVFQSIKTHIVARQPEPKKPAKPSAKP
ncbi:MAG: helix-hairpin-helix domain-containing protein [Burkholderiales bacterium]